MATQQFSTPVDHSSDAAFRAWALELSTKLQAAGLVKTANTGQIDLGTALKPASNTAAGYEIYRFNDALQATFPVFVKLEYGSSSSGAAIPQIWMTVSTATNGAGVMSGIVGARSPCANGNGSLISTITNYNTNICVIDGAMACCWKMGGIGGTKASGFFGVCRSVDDAGAITGTGIYTYCQSTAAFLFVQVLDLAGGVARTASSDGSHCLVPQGVLSSSVGGNVQAFKHYLATPLVRPVFAFMTVLTPEVGANTTYSLIPIGSTVSHTYISLGVAQKYGAVLPAETSNIAMIWE